MSEGPQARYKADWLDRALRGKRIISCTAQNAALEETAKLLKNTVVRTVYARGKHIFFEFENDLMLHNHLLMQGTWRLSRDTTSEPPAGTWLSLRTAGITVHNVGGQVLELADAEQARRIVSALGPDIMDRPLPAGRIRDSLTACPLPVAEAVMDQAVLSGIGNICRSEALFAAGIAPQLRPVSLGEPALQRLIETLASLCWESYRNRGHWRTQVYRKHGKPCPRCANPIARIRLPPSRRAIYYCPVCQPTGEPNRQLSLFPDLV